MTFLNAVHSTYIEGPLSMDRASDLEQPRMVPIRTAQPEQTPKHLFDVHGDKSSIKVGPMTAGR